MRNGRGCRVTKPSKKRAASSDPGSAGRASWTTGATGRSGRVTGTSLMMARRLDTSTQKSSSGILTSYEVKSQGRICSVTRLLIAASALTPSVVTWPSAIEVSSRRRSEPGASCSCPDTKRLATKSLRGRQRCEPSVSAVTGKYTERGTSSAAASLRARAEAPSGQETRFSAQEPSTWSPCLPKARETSSMSMYSAASASPPRWCLSCSTAVLRAAASAPGAESRFWYAAARRASESQSGEKGSSGWWKGRRRIRSAWSRGTRAEDGCRASRARPASSRGVASKLAISGFTHKTPTISTVSRSRSDSTSPS
mmetsp:Transcript_126245/g.306809  ORF Transcript_126245/g.306809 Transcript_126245/m.306809 type:complete len:311 (+) Transcript_126245:514-1446(+)